MRDRPRGYRPLAAGYPYAAPRAAGDPGADVREHGTIRGRAADAPNGIYARTTSRRLADRTSAAGRASRTGPFEPLAICSSPPRWAGGASPRGADREASSWGARDQLVTGVKDAGTTSRQAQTAPRARRRGEVVGPRGGLTRMSCHPARAQGRSSSNAAVLCHPPSSIVGRPRPSPSWPFSPFRPRVLLAALPPTSAGCAGQPIPPAGGSARHFASPAAPTPRRLRRARSRAALVRFGGDPRLRRGARRDSTCALALVIAIAPWGTRWRSAPAPGQLSAGRSRPRGRGSPPARGSRARLPDAVGRVGTTDLVASDAPALVRARDCGVARGSTIRGDDLPRALVRRDGAAGGRNSTLVQKRAARRSSAVSGAAAIRGSRIHLTATLARARALAARRAPLRRYRAGAAHTLHMPSHTSRASARGVVGRHERLSAYLHADSSLPRAARVDTITQPQMRRDPRAGGGTRCRPSPRVRPGRGRGRAPLRWASRSPRPARHARERGACTGPALVPAPPRFVAGREDLLPRALCSRAWAPDSARADSTRSVP